MIVCAEKGRNMVRMTQAQLDSILKQRNPVKENKVVEASPIPALNLEFIDRLKERIKEPHLEHLTAIKEKKEYIFKRVKNSTCGWEVDEAATLLKNKEV